MERSDVPRVTLSAVDEVVVVVASPVAEARGGRGRRREADARAREAGDARTRRVGGERVTADMARGVLVTRDSTPEYE